MEIIRSGKMKGRRMKSKNYDEFVEKFKPKKTTDDCYTPPEIYEAIKRWVCLRYGINPENTVRPFWPGADYKTFDYSEDSVVLDNPPFSILAQICEYYLKHGIRFFLFSPTLTALSSKKTWDKINHLICDCDIVYENGANIGTSFVTNLDKDVIAQTCPELTRIVNSVSKKLKEEKAKKLPKYEYPEHIVTAAMMQRFAKWGVDFEVRSKDCTRVRRLDAQKSQKKAIFGSGLLLSEKAAAEKAAAEKVAAEKAAAEKENAVIYQLSQRELDIVARLGS